MKSSPRTWRALRWAIGALLAALVLTLFADWRNDGPWTSPPDLVYARVTGLPPDTTYILFVGEREGDLFLLDHYFDEGWFGGPSRREHGVGLFGPVARNGEVTQTIAWADFDRLAILAAGPHGEWKMRWVPTETFLIPSRVVPVRRVSIDIALDSGVPFEALPEQFENSPMLERLPKDESDGK